MRRWQYLAVLMVLGAMAFSKGPPPKAKEWKMRDDSQANYPVLTLTHGSGPIERTVDAKGNLTSLSFPPPESLTISSEKGRVVSIDLKTGKTTVYGDPDAAARAFWVAVETLGAKACAKPK